MTLFPLPSLRRAALVGVAAAAIGAGMMAPAQATDGSRERVVLHRLDTLDGHRRVSMAPSRRRLARGARRHRGNLGVARRARRGAAFAAGPVLWFAPAGIPAGYASDESAYNVDADDDAFDTGAFYGCLHTVMTAGGYRPADTCY